MVGDAQDLASSKDSMHKIRLIDYGLCKKYVDQNGEHKKQQNETVFEGNITFASKNALNLKSLSRRDDLMQLCYLLLYIIDGDLIFFDDNDDLTQSQIYIKVKQMKNRLSPEILCSQNEETQILAPFMKEIFALDFPEKPNYQRLK